MKKSTLCLLVMLPISSWGIYTAIRDLDRNSTMRVAIGQTTAKASLLGTEYPKKTTSANLRSYGAAMEKVDVSATPADFQGAFRDWARAWTEAADLLDREGAPANRRAKDRVDAARKKLNVVTEKYGV